MAGGAAVVRAVVEEEVKALKALRLEALIAHPEAFAADVELTKARPEEEWAAQIAEGYRANSQRTFVVEVGDGLVGMAGVVRGHWPKLRHGAHIWGVYVRPGWRGQGLGEALVTAAVDWARAEGVQVVRLAVVTTNAAAIRCYARCGFSVYGVEPMALRAGEVFYDELLMVKRL